MVNALWELPPASYFIHRTTDISQYQLLHEFCTCVDAVVVHYTNIFVAFPFLVLYLLQTN